MNRLNENLKRICVVGAGRWGKNHIRTLSGMGVLAGIVESDAAAVKAVQALAPDVPVYGNICDVPFDRFDGFTIATPAETHFNLARIVIENRKHVLVEKPITLNSNDARLLKELAEKNGVNLMVGHVLLFHPAIRKIKALMLDDKIGKPEYLYSNRLNLGTVRTEENILWSFAPHDLSIFQYLIEDFPIEVLARGGTFLQPHIHDTTMTLMRYPNNIVGHIFVSWLHPFKEQRLVVIGSKGMLSFEDSSDGKELYFYEKGIDWVEGEPIKRDGPTEVIPYERSMPLTEELGYFVEHLDGSPVQVADGRNALDVLRILEMATESLLVNSGPQMPAKTEAPQTGYFVHPTSQVDDGVRIGKHTKVWHYSHVQTGTEIGERCSLGQNVNIGNHVRIGNGVKIQNNVSVYEGVELEDYVFCGPSMVFTNIMQPRSEFPQRGTAFYLKTRVKKSASLGANSTIVCGTTIGRYAFVGAGAVVTKDVPDFALVVGNPARFLSWVCKCGHKIAFESKNQTECAHCGRSFELSDEQVACVRDLS